MVAVTQSGEMLAKSILVRSTMMDISRLTKRLSVLEHEQSIAREKLVAINSCIEWCKNESTDIIAVHNTGIHKIAESIWLGLAIDSSTGRDAYIDVSDQHHNFITGINWYGVLGGHVMDGDDIRLPYPTCSFEYRLNGTHVCVFCKDSDGEQEYRIAAEFGRVWVVGNPRDDVIRLIRTCCVALEAGCAVAREVLAPPRLNKKREAAGKFIVPNYHVIDVPNRSCRRDSAGSTGSKKRLHFRRGHWRHYESHKKWISWMLVGNPDLGYISKDYRLSSSSA